MLKYTSPRSGALEKHLQRIWFLPCIVYYFSANARDFFSIISTWNKFSCEFSLLLFYLDLKKTTKQATLYIRGCSCRSFSLIVFIKKRGRNPNQLLHETCKHIPFSSVSWIESRGMCSGDCRLLLSGQCVKVACGLQWFMFSLRNLHLFSLLFSRKQSESTLWCWKPMENFTKDRFVWFFYLFSELICSEKKSACGCKYIVLSNTTQYEVRSSVNRIIAYGQKPYIHSVCLCFRLFLISPMLMDRYI